jgi:hypothetical protein
MDESGTNTWHASLLGAMVVPIGWVLDILMSSCSSIQYRCKAGFVQWDGLMVEGLYFILAYRYLGGHKEFSISFPHHLAQFPFVPLSTIQSLPAAVISAD